MKIFSILSITIFMFAGLASANTDHTELIEDSLLTVQEVTETCLSCHEDAASEVMKTIHWTWKGKEKTISGHKGSHAIGKMNVFNNYCIAVESNWQRCTSCHVGYGWKDETFDFEDETKVDCLICHDQTGKYKKDPKGAGMPVEGLDLTAIVQSVGVTTRDNCGVCHFHGGGGENVKHGDLDHGLSNPEESYDVHMGNGMTCTDCHTTEGHDIQGKSMVTLTGKDNRVQCADCHEAAETHHDKVLNKHAEKIACQTCHIPEFAKGQPTKMYWDWSTAGTDTPVEKDEYGMDNFHKKKGTFKWGKNVTPEYYWYNGSTDRYLKGDKLNPDEVVSLNTPHGSINDVNAKIYPFKVTRGKQIYDSKNNYLIVPKLFGDGYWKHFDWNKASEDGMKAAGLDYSGEYGFVSTEMYGGIDHMVSPKEEALKCKDCHFRGENKRLDWKALGYPGDQMYKKNRK